MYIKKISFCHVSCMFLPFFFFLPCLFSLIALPRVVFFFFFFKLLILYWIGAALLAQMVKSLPAKPRSSSSIPGLGRSPGE